MAKGSQRRKGLGENLLGHVVEILNGDVRDSLSRTDIAKDFLNSQGARIKLVDNFYAEFLGRNADSAGQAAWLSQIAGGFSLDSVAEQFLGSDEYFSRN